MTESDDYFEDSLELDEAALASIQATEERFGASISQTQATRFQSQRVSPPRSSPPHKRFKTTQGWVEPIINHGESRSFVRPPLQKVDDDPEIVVNSDGSYVLNTDGVADVRAGRGGLHGQIPRPHVQGPQEAFNDKKHDMLKSHLAPRPPYQRTTSDQRHAAAARPSFPQSPPPKTVTPAGSGSTSLENELSALRAQLSELTASHAIAMQSLSKAQEEQFLKAGEASNLRRTIEKTEREHVETTAKLRAEKETAEKLKDELQIKLKEETDRMATRLIFKQQELETSTRKRNWGSSVSRRMIKEPSQTGPAVANTPTRTSSQMPFPFVVRTGSELPNTSQSRRMSPQPWDESAHPLSSPIHNQGTGVIKQPLFKGFKNAFTDSAPVLTKSPRKGREKVGRDEEEEQFFQLGVAAQSEPNDDSRSNRDKGEKKRIDESWSHDQTGRGYDCEELDDDRMSVDDGHAYGEYSGDGKEALTQVDESLGDEAIIEAVGWKELGRIVFTHMGQGTDMLTLQLLLSTRLPDQMCANKRWAFLVACQTILRKCGGKHGSDQYHDDLEWNDLVIEPVASAFIIVAEILSDAGYIESLVSLLDLMTMLTLYIPAILSSFLGPIAATGILPPVLVPDGPSQLLYTLENIIRDHIALVQRDTTENDVETSRVDLATAVIQLMESLYWNVKDGAEAQLQVLSNRCQVLEMLLHTKQPSKLIKRTLRLLVLIATHKFAFRSLLSVVETPESATAENKSRLSLVDRLCHYLVDSTEKDYHSIKQLTITFMTLLCDIHAGASNILLDSVSLAPSVIVCITNLSRLLWEDNIDLMNSTKDAQLVLETIYLLMNFLRNLVLTPKASVNLGHRLIEVTHSPGLFNGITHMFMVTFGRLSWAEAPDWLNSECKGTCEIISELALEVMETVVVGPEFDSLWAVWHLDEELDDEEVEAQMIQLE